MKIFNMAAWPAVILGASFLAGCNVSGSYHDDNVDLEDAPPCCVDQFAYRMDVLVADTFGFRLVGASVELYVATVPEQRYLAVTEGDGIARFHFQSPADVTAVAYACAPGYECNAADTGTSPNSSDLFINVVLNF